MNFNGETVCVADVEASTHKCVALTPQDQKYYFNFAWSPDSTQIALVNRQNTLSNWQNIEVVHIDTMIPTVLTHYAFGIRSVAWSPVDNKILFSVIRSQPNGSSILAMNADGTNLHPVWGEDVVALSSDLTDFSYGLDDTHTLLFNSPSSWWHNSDQNTLYFAPSQAAFNSTQMLPFEGVYESSPRVA